MRIGALAAATGTTARTLRFYEQSGLLEEPARTPGGYRDYPPQAVARVDFVRTAQAAGLSLAEIHGILTIRDSGRPPCAHVTALLEKHLADVDRRLAELHATQATLRKLARTAAATDPATCAEGDICRILTGT
ncbi:MerR family DNA-binding protein [Kitasatospora sp. LaBMicrA B282]|uniref:MerR family DNA-binding protein n=1 Tax=Kitasatospora sp. LaBMicrA B282 TaxID=3420949 RepID=UPI003D148FC0